MKFFLTLIIVLRFYDLIFLSSFGNDGKKKFSYYFYGFYVGNTRSNYIKS